MRGWFTLPPVLFTLFATLPASLAAAEDSANADAESPTLPELERFVAEETGDDFLAKSIMPTTEPVTGVYGQPMNLLDIPRAVSVITPEAMTDFGIRGMENLERVSANTTQANFFGIAGIPYIRGRNANVFFNGIRKLYQRNEAPTSVYAAESLEVVKGPAPAHFGPSRVGGYVNIVPKAPYLDDSRGHIKATYGSYNFYQVQVDGSVPVMLGEMPGAFRVSVTGQLADSYYNNVENNFVEAYASAIIQIDKNNSIFTGAEYFNVRANENPGWNRATQDLIDNGRYLGGEPVNLTSAYAGGIVGKGSVPGYGSQVGNFRPSVPLNTPIASNNRVGANTGPIAFPGNPDGSPTTASPYPPGTQFGALIPPAAWVAANVPPAQAALLGPNGEYTPDYLAAGGPLYTVSLDGNQVLVDEQDYARSQDFVYFADWVNSAHPDRVIKNQIFFEYFDTDRRSTYGYAIEAQQFAVENRFSVSQNADNLFQAGEESIFTSGLSLRYTYARMLRDFDAEPFSRRDISQPTVSDNSRVITGGQTNADGTNNWSIFPNGSVQSNLYELGIFTTWQAEWNEWLQTIIDLRGDLVFFDARQPDEPNYPWPGYIAFGGTTASARGSRGGGGAAFSPVFTVTEGLNLYGTINYTTTQLFESVNAVTGGNSFGQAMLYEVGAKASLLNDTLYAGVAAYYFDENRLEAQVGNRLDVRGEGLEVELTWVPTRNFSLLATAGWQRVYLRSGLPFRFQDPGARLPLVAGGNFASSGDPTGLVAQNNPDKIIPAVPELTANLFAIYQFDNGLGAGIGPSFRSSQWLNYEHTLKAPSAVVWNAIAYYRRPSWEILLEVTNLFSADVFYGGTEFASSTLVTKAPPIEAKLSVSWLW